MRVEYINPFVETSFKILSEVLGGAQVTRGDLYLKSTDAGDGRCGACRSCW
jgi:chemotaxis protein CheX